LTYGILELNRGNKYLQLVATKTIRSKSSHIQSLRLCLEDGRYTTVHIAKYSKRAVRPQLVLFEKATRLLDWCRKEEVLYAINGGFFCRQQKRPLGEVWLNGAERPSTAFAGNWGAVRGTLHIDEDGEVEVAGRERFQAPEINNLLQAGPLLVRRGMNLIAEGVDAEGFSATNHQFDADIVNGRFPRTAIGANADSIICVVADGYSNQSPGLTMVELAELMIRAGADKALNLDGGASASMIYNGRLINTSRTRAFVNNTVTNRAYNYPLGRPIFSAIIFT
jgi:exopolysaccharide biosynthesis protein